MDSGKLRAWWSSRQGLDGSLRGESAADALSKVGWARSVGGANPYLTLFARTGGSRESIDADVAGLRIHELPSARGCTYVLPADDFALGLRLSYPFNEKGDISVATKYLGVSDDEIDRLCTAIRRAVTGRTLDVAVIKSEVGHVVRNLGEEGKRRGVTTTLPLALGRLQSLGQIRRVPIGGRLDQQRYSYTAWDPSPCHGDAMSNEEAGRMLADKYFRWTGPASLAHFQWFSGFTVRAAKAAIEGLDLMPIEPGSELMILASERAAFDAFEVPSSRQVSLVNGLDSLFLLRRDLFALIQDGHADHPLMAGSAKDLEYNAIVDRGAVIGLWEYDPKAGEIVWATFEVPPAEVLDAIETMEQFIREQLGDARTFSLDSPASRKPKLDALRSVASLATR